MLHFRLEVGRKKIAQRDKNSRLQKVPTWVKAIFESNREKLSAARAEIKEVRRTAKQSLALKQEVARLGGLLAEAGVDARKRSTVVLLRMENASLKV